MSKQEQTFHMPVYQGEIFEQNTQSILCDAFANLDIPARDERVRFLEFRFHVVGASGERVIAEKDINLHPDPVIFDADLSPAGSEALKDIMVAWVRDDLVEQSVVAHPFPWQDKDRVARMADRYLSLYWRPEFSVLAQEFIPTFLEGDDLDPLGEGQSKAARTALASLILPASGSSQRVGWRTTSWFE